MGIIYAVSLIVVGFGIYEYIKGKRISTDVNKFNEERNAAMALDKELQLVRKASTRSTEAYEEAVKRYRAKFGSAKRPPDGGSGV